MDEAARAYWAAGESMVARRDAARREQVAFLESVLDFLDAYPSPVPLPGPAAERMVPAGGEEAGETGEWVSLDVGTLLGMSSPAAWHLVRDAANLRARHPRLWAAFAELRVEEWQARRVARMCAELSAESARWVDERLADVWGTVPWARILRRLDGLITRADQELAARRARKEQRGRFMSVRHLGDSTSMVVARIDTSAALHLQETIHRITGEMVAAGATEPLPFLAALALEELATPRLPSGGASGNPDSRLPLADLVVHIAAEDLDPGADGSGVVRVTGRGGDVGPVLLDQVAQLLGHRRVRVIPVIDLAGDPSVDGYEIPHRMRRQMGVREEYSIFPYSTFRSRCSDLDHTVPYRRSTPGSPAPPSQTRVSNLGPLARTEHRAKTAGAWRLDQPAPGLYVWTDRMGRRWAVIAGHTHRLPDARPPESMPEDEQMPEEQEIRAQSPVDHARIAPAGHLTVPSEHGRDASGGHTGGRAWRPRIDVIFT